MDLYKDKYLKYKNKYLALQSKSKYLNLFRTESYQFLRNRDGEGFVNKSDTSNKIKYHALQSKQYLQIGNGSLYTKMIELYPQFISKEISKEMIETIIINSSIGVQKEAIDDAIRDNNFDIFKILMKYTSNVDNHYLVYIKENLYKIFKKTQPQFIFDLIKKGYDINYINQNIFPITEEFIDKTIERGLKLSYFLRLKNISPSIELKIKKLLYIELIKKGMNINEINKMIPITEELIDIAIQLCGIQPMIFLQLKSISIPIKIKLREVIHEMTLSKLSASEFPDIDTVLVGKYLDEYMEACKTILSNPLMKIPTINDFYSKYIEYKYKVKQYLQQNKCIENRLRQTAGGCWLNGLLNNFILDDFFKNRMTEFISRCIENRIISLDMISTPLIENESIERIEGDEESNESLIFNKIIHILYQIICKKGIRNINKIMKNKCIVNLAYLIKFYDNSEELDKALLQQDTAYSSYNIFLLIITLFNEKMVKSNPDIKTNFIIRDNILNDSNTINHLIIQMDISDKDIEISNISTISIINSESMYLDIEKIDIQFNGKHILKPSKPDTTDEILYNVISFESIDFLTVRIIKGTSIPTQIILNGVIFELSSVGLSIEWDKTELSKKSIDSGHAILGFKCKDEYFLYDSNDRFFKADWTDISEQNISHVYNYYNLFMMNSLKDDKMVYPLNIRYTYAIYHNTRRKFTHPQICL